VHIQAVRLVLRENDDLAIPRVDEVGESEIDESIPAAEGDGGFGSLRGERQQSLALPTRENHG